jgi:hypothetical protein
MRPEELLQAVQSLQTDQVPVVRAIEIMEWCNRQTPPIRFDSGKSGRKNDLFELADLGEARGQHRLQKYKQGPAMGARGAWALIERRDAARAWACKNGWLEVPWAGENWDWQNAFPVCDPPPAT